MRWESDSTTESGGGRVRSMRDLLHALGAFLIGILARFYFWIFALFLDPFDLYSRFKPSNWWDINMPQWIGLTALGLLLLWSAFLTYFEIWKTQNTPKKRLSIVEFAAVARKKFGWRFGGSSQEAFDLVDGIRQAIVDRVLTLEGRFNPTEVPEELKLHYPLRPIDDPEQLSQYVIDIPMFFDGTTNYMTRVSTKYFETTICRDLHISDTEAALNWLRHEGPKWKGQRAKANEAAKKRRDAILSEFHSETVQPSSEGESQP